MNVLIKISFFTFFIANTLLLASCSTTHPTTEKINQSTGKTVLPEKFRNDYTKAIADIEATKYRQATSSLHRIMADNPGFTDGWANLALAQLRAGDIQQAKQSALNAVQLEQNSASLENLLGLIHVEDGSYKNAENNYKRALELNPAFANAHYNLALLNDIYYQNITRAIQHYERYLALINKADPDTEAWVAELKRNIK